jgi:hypothetical protein
MKIKKKIIVSVLGALLVSVVVPLSSVYAASASFYISPGSSSVTKGNKVTVQVRINSGSDRMDTAQARINFDGSKLQYVSHSAGNFPQFTTSKSSSSFEYAGVILGSYTSGNKLLFSITFKAVNSGTSSLSLSSVQAAYSGAALSVSASGGSVSISNPSSGGGGSSGGSTDSGGSSTGGSTSTGTESEQEEEKKVTPPKIVGKPVFDVTQSTITAKLRASKPSQVLISYKADGSKKAQTVRERSAKTKHSVVIGADKPLLAGTKYTLEITLIDKDGNKSKKATYSARTQGVTYSTQIIDSHGQPLANHPVALHSDPIEATTDAQGFAVFEDVTPGEHTLVFEIEGITVRQPVQVGQPVVTAGESEDAKPNVVQLPFQLAGQAESAPTPAKWTSVLLAGFAGAMGMLVLRLSITRRLAAFLLHRLQRLLAKVHRKPRHV